MPIPFTNKYLNLECAPMAFWLIVFLIAALTALLIIRMRKGGEGAAARPPAPVSVPVSLGTVPGPVAVPIHRDFPDPRPSAHVSLELESERVHIIGRPEDVERLLQLHRSNPHAGRVLAMRHGGEVVSFGPHRQPCDCPQCTIRRSAS